MHSCNPSVWGCTVFQKSIVNAASTHSLYKTTLDVDTIERQFKYSDGLGVKENVLSGH